MTEQRGGVEDLTEKNVNTLCGKGPKAMSHELYTGMLFIAVIGGGYAARLLYAPSKPAPWSPFSLPRYVGGALILLREGGQFVTV